MLQYLSAVRADYIPCAINAWRAERQTELSLLSKQSKLLKSKFRVVSGAYPAPKCEGVTNYNPFWKLSEGGCQGACPWTSVPLTCKIIHCHILT